MAVNHQLLRDDGWPRGVETAALARRMALVRWFVLPRDPLERTTRLAGALADHARLVLGREAPASSAVLAGDEGRRSVAQGDHDLTRQAWQAGLSRRLEEARALLISSGRGRSHPVLDCSGDAVLMRPGLLPIDLALVRARLQGEGETALEEEVVEILARRLEWEMGALVLWEAVADLLGPNPFTCLLAIYEEGYYPLDLGGDAPLLWAPGSADGRPPS